MPMTVRELINKLEEFGDQLEVVIVDDSRDNWYAEVDPLVDTETIDSETVVTLKVGIESR